MGAINGRQYVRWFKKKPKANKECLLLVANFFEGKWEYTLYLVIKVYFEHSKGFYYGLCNSDGEEWGDYNELTADLYCIIKPLKGK